MSSNLSAKGEEKLKNCFFTRSRPGRIIQNPPHPDVPIFSIFEASVKRDDKTLPDSKKFPYDTKIVPGKEKSFLGWC